ncbi:MAG: glycosyltransferase family 2 protein [Aquaticitalea sp.]
MKRPLVSILIPFKNTESYLPECLDSILKQTYPNWEVLIVDDNSTDQSCTIVESYASKDERIKLLKNKGEGIIDALKYAFNHSKGDYITRMDSDDIMTEDKLEVLLHNLLTKGRNHLTVGLVHYFSKEGINDGYARYEAWLNQLTRQGSNFSEIYKECVIPSPCWMLHREDLIACDAFNPNRYPEDYDLTFRFYKNKMKCIPCNKVLHHWRDYDTRTSRTHEHYAQNYFLDIKLHYFLELDHQPTRPLTVWGAGFKGKRIAKLLKKNSIPFIWICNNPKKIGKHIYGIELHNFNHLSELQNPQTIITVANPQSQKRIQNYLHTLQMTSMTDYFFFC